MAIMPKIPEQLETRLARIEQELAELRAALEVRRAEPWYRRIVGDYGGDEAFLVGAVNQQSRSVPHAQAHFLRTLSCCHSGNTCNQCRRPIFRRPDRDSGWRTTAGRPAFPY